MDTADDIGQSVIPQVSSRLRVPRSSEYDRKVFLKNIKPLPKPDFYANFSPRGNDKSNHPFTSRISQVRSRLEPITEGPVRPRALGSGSTAFFDSPPSSPLISMLRVIYTYVCLHFGQ
jgi:hypothetical protein